MFECFKNDLNYGSYCFVSLPNECVFSNDTFDTVTRGVMMREVYGGGRL